MNLTEKTISFGSQSFLIELFCCFSLIESNIVLLKLARFWSKYMYYYHDYMIVFLSNHMILANYFEALRRLIQRPGIVDSIKLFCEPFLYFPTNGPIDLIHFLENSAVFNPNVIPRTTDDIVSPSAPPTTTPIQTFGTMGSMGSMASMASLFSTSRASLFFRSNTTPTPLTIPPASAAPTMVSPRASMSALFSAGALPGEKLNIFTLIGFPPLFQDYLGDFPEIVSTLYNSFKIILPHSTILHLADSSAQFLEQYPFLTSQIQQPPELARKESKRTLFGRQTSPPPETAPADQSNRPWYRRTQPPSRGGLSDKEISICKYAPKDTFHSGLKEPVVKLYSILNQICLDFLQQEDLAVNPAWEKPSRERLIQDNYTYNAKQIPLSVRNFIEEIFLHPFGKMSIQLSFHPRARIIPHEFFQTILTYISFSQLAQILDTGYFSKYFPGPEFGIYLPCQSVITTLTDNFFLTTSDKENFLILMFQLSSIFRILWLYLMYASTIELISEDVRVKYASRNDYYYFSKMMILAFETLTPSPSQGHLFMQYFASIAIFRSSKWIDVLVTAEIHTHARQFIRYADAAPENYALQSNSIITLFSYLYDWLFTFSTLGNYKSVQNKSRADVPVEVTLLDKQWQDRFLQSSVQIDGSAQGNFLIPWSEVERNDISPYKAFRKLKIELELKKDEIEQNEDRNKHDLVDNKEYSPKLVKNQTIMVITSSNESSPSSFDDNNNKSIPSVEKIENSTTRNQSDKITPENPQETDKMKEEIALLDEYDTFIESIYAQSKLNHHSYIALLEARSWEQIDVNQIATLSTTQLNTITSWCSKMLRNSTLPPQIELSNSIFSLFQTADNVRKQVVLHQTKMINPVGRLYPPSQLPFASDEQLALVLENVMKAYIGGILLQTEELDKPVK
jgi:hypothetical protein